MSTLSIFARAGLRLASLPCAFLLVFLFLWVPSDGGAQDAEGEAQTGETIEVGTGAISDEAIAQRIGDILSELDGYDRVEIAVAEGIVTLSGAVIDGEQRAELSQIATRVEGVIAVQNETNVSGTLEERLEPAVDRIAERGRNILANAPIFLIAMAAFAIVAVTGWLFTSRTGLWSRIAPNKFVANVYRAVARIVFVLLGVVLALDLLNATALIGAVLGAAGVVGLALGFAVRDTVENFIASLLLSLRQPFRPNDIVEVQGDVGMVARLTSRATILISPEGNHIRIPNATVFKGRIVNFTRHPERRFDFDLGVDADADLAGALSVATAALSQLVFVLDDPEVSAWVSEVGDSNVVLTFTGWVDQTQTDFLKARGEAIRAAKTALEEAGFGLPEPIYRVRIADQTGTTASSDPVEETIVAPSRPANLPNAADPQRTEDANSDAARRERAQAEGETDLLDENQKVE